MTHIGKFRNVESMLEATPDLGAYKGDFSEHNENIYPTDLDAIVEVKGEFLVHEYKKVGAPENTGQQILLEALRKKGFSTIEIYHIGPCWDMNFERAIFTTPNYMPINKTGKTSITYDVHVMAAIRRFHIWWTKQILMRGDL